MDDMVQDVVDCVDWLRDNVHMYDGDKVGSFIYVDFRFNFVFRLVGPHCSGGPFSWWPLGYDGSA